MRGRGKNRIPALLLCVALLLSGCVMDAPVLMPQYTVPPKVTPTPAPTPSPEPTPEPTAEPTPAPLFDATGTAISGLDHYKRYIRFRDIQVYEQCEDTFVDAVVVNSYPDPILCAVSISFYEEEGGEPVATDALQTRDGQYVLTLQPGETVVFAQIDTDVSVTDMPYTLTFDTTLGVLPA